MKPTLSYFGKKVNLLRASFDIEEPKLPWKRRVPTRFEEGTDEGTFFDDCKSYFHSMYYEALDLIINCVKERFDQPGYGIYKNLQDIIIKSIRRKAMMTALMLLLFYTNPILIPIRLGFT